MTHASAITAFPQTASRYGCCGSLSRVSQAFRNLVLGIKGTPAFVIGDQLVPGAADMDTFKRLVAKARKG